jgi:hypothetical protein
VDVVKRYTHRVNPLNAMEEIITFVSPYLENPWVNLATAVVALASAIAAVTPTPKEGSAWAKIYKVIDLLSINIGKAKDKNK